MIYVINEDTYKALPKDVQATVDSEGACIEDEKTEHEIADLAGMPNDAANEQGEEKPGEQFKYGAEDQYTGQLNPDGSMADLPESEKNSIKDMGAAGDRGMALIVAMGKKKAGDLHKVSPIPKKPNADEEAKKAEPTPAVAGGNG